MKSLSWRRKADVSLIEPVNPVDLCLKLGLQVRFVDISMEGMYHGGKSPSILLSSFRPSGRRNFTCAHELGHHAFEHGSTIDELHDNTSKATFQREEYLADVFAGHFLMPIPGVMRAFTDRKTSIECATAALFIQVASAFGVGYDTLISHLNATNNLSDLKAKELRKVGVAGGRTQFLGFAVNNHLLVIDDDYECKTADMEVGNLISLPLDVEITGSLLTPIRMHAAGQLFEATKPGICRVTSLKREWAAFVRVCRRSYVGLAAYRHLENEDEQS